MLQGRPLTDDAPESGPTRGYDGQFLGDDSPIILDFDAFDHLEAASQSLSMFSHQAQQALESIGLTGDQRLHISKILVFVQDLGRRLDVVRVPGFECSQPKAQ